MRDGGVVCIGGAVVDRKYLLRADAVAGTSNPAAASTSHGGVARNVAENLARLGVPVALVSRVGSDVAGADLVRHTASAGVDVARGVAVGGQTAEYVAVLDPAGDLVLGVAAMDVLDGLTAADVDAAWPSAGWVFTDCNPPAAVLAAAVARARETGVPLAVDAVSTPKVAKLPRDLTGVAVLFCNGDEARAFLAATSTPLGAGAAVLPDDAAAAGLLAAGAAAVVLTRGAAGVVLADHAGIRSLAAHPAAVVDVTGAGDALVAGALAGLVAGRPLDRAAAEGIRLAAWTVESPHTVRPDRPPAALHEEDA